MTEPSRGEIWSVDFDPVRGREPKGRRPALVFSVDGFNHGPAGLVVVLPITSKDKGIPLRVGIEAPEGGLRTRSFVKCEDIRSVSKERLSRRFGRVSRPTLEIVEDRVKILLGL